WACLGISLGGMVAMDWAKRYSDDFAKLVLINVSSKDVAAVHHRISLFAIYCMLRAAFSRDMEGRERQILKMISNLRSRDPLTVEKMVEIATTSDESADKIFRQIVAASQFVAPESLKPPTLFLASLKDKMVDVRCSKMIAERLAAKI